MWVAGAREDVLKPVGLEHGLLDHASLRFAQLAPASPSKVLGVGGGLRLHDRIDRSDQLDQLVDREIPRRCADPGIEASPLELVHDRVLAFLSPMEEEDIPVKLGEIGILADAFTV